MKKNQKAELRQKNESELGTLLVKKRQELTETKFKLCQGQVKNVHLITRLKDEIAQIMTIIREGQKK